MDGLEEDDRLPEDDMEREDEDRLPLSWVTMTLPPYLL